MPQPFYKKIEKLEYFQPTPWNNNRKNYIPLSFHPFLLKYQIFHDIYIYTHTHKIKSKKKRSKEKYCSAPRKRRIAIYEKKKERKERREITRWMDNRWWKVLTIFARETLISLMAFDLMGGGRGVRSAVALHATRVSVNAPCRPPLRL